MEHHPSLFILFFLLFPTLSTTLKWLWIHNGLNNNHHGSENVCDHSAFINKQVQFCKNNPVFMDSIRVAAGRSIQECQYQFRYNKWNCSIDLTPLGGNHNSRRNQRTLAQQHHQQHQQKKKVKFPFVAQGTREAAFIYSLSSAGVAHQLTKSCSAGLSPDCGCDKSLTPSKSSAFKWAGCSDNIDYGVSLSRSFVDAHDHRMSRKNKTVTLALVNLHNNEAGRKIMERLMRLECKCHGVSGSCEIKTCWRVMPNLRQIGEFLRSKFEFAKMVEEKKIGSRRGLAVKNSEQRGSLGTKGRVCRQVSFTDNVSTIPDSCSKLCCNRGHTTHRVRRSERCKCKFHWCCSVTCSECTKELEISTCN
ncbi:unnamed protein product [Allacma fusca]|uniref:Protein Wnt n=1 Tax=Allacma fusca TaxID=39272 RepID=A0A8J2NNS9_9HEXA|nr:unnamed protein product [Allacma fusca]